MLYSKLGSFCTCTASSGSRCAASRGVAGQQAAGELQLHFSNSGSCYRASRGAAVQEKNASLQECHLHCQSVSAGAPRPTHATAADAHAGRAPHHHHCHCHCLAHLLCVGIAQVVLLLHGRYKTTFRGRQIQFSEM